jgi:hypothetical protein
MNPWDSMPEEWKRVFAKRIKVKGECWVIPSPNGKDYYATARVGGRDHVAHRLSYVLAGGVIPEALVLDHLCNQKRCVRPDHLEAVTVMENSRREVLRRPPRPRPTHCKAGHERNAANSYIGRDGRWRCRPCQRRHRARWNAKRRRGRPRKTRYNPNQWRLFE